MLCRPRCKRKQKLLAQVEGSMQGRKVDSTEACLIRGNGAFRRKFADSGTVDE